MRKKEGEKMRREGREEKEGKGREGEKEGER